MKNVIVFKTNVEYSDDENRLKELITYLHPGIVVNFDLGGCDRVLRR